MAAAWCVVSNSAVKIEAISEFRIAESGIVSVRGLDWAI
jgi:hypothetical protein